MRPLVIGTRGSALALWQANHVKATLERLHGVPVSLQVIKTIGDKILDAPLAKVGGKGLFVKELEEALLRRETDLAVHSMKDVPTEMPAGLVLTATSVREDPHDVAVTRDGRGLWAQRPGARVGTSSLRRVCQVLHRRPDFEVESLRGNVDTRLRKLDEGQYDAIVLAAAGLRRLGHGHRISETLSFEASLPAIGQGALGLECRADDAEVRAMVAPLDDPATATAVRCERAFLLRLQGGCQTPIAAHAVATGDRLAVAGLVGRVDGTEILRGQADGPAGDPEALGVRLAEDLLGRGAQRILDEMRAL
ncbi:MAG: hydroxymethylbilane synthase [Deltaproteobacteria bacterium]|nr:hydroxymethylbilane synthase [Deltaproteobacteria bacterium]